jgi:hypothetical protein
MELVRICRYVTGIEAIIFKAFVFYTARPDKNENYANYKKDIRQVGLFKRQLIKHFYIG